jgi:acetyl-CoA acyltransferase
LQTIANAAERIMTGQARTILAGGCEHMSTTIEMPNFSPSPSLVATNPAVYMGMGLTGEQVAREFDVSREDQDEFALRSHTLAQKAVEGGLFDEEIVPLDVEFDWVDENGEVRHMETTFRRDEGPRDTSLEKLAKLPTVFQQGGTVTAGNSSQRSDGAAAVVVMEREEAERRGLTPLARFVGFAVGGVRPEVMGIGPSVAIPKVLEIAGLTIDDIDLVEFNEAFAAQFLAVVREVGLDLDKTNVNGGAIALGHPLGMSGARLALTATEELHRRGGRYALCAMCIGVGQGIALAIERV